MQKEMDIAEVTANQTEMRYETDRTIQSLFEEAVIKYADKTAVIYRDEKISYDELNRKSNQLARQLRKHGIRPDMIVGIMVNRSAHMFIGLLGILKAGACYLPIDPKFPESRIDYMLEDSKAQLLITEHDITNCYVFENQKLYLDDDIYQGDDSNLEPLASSQNLAYLIYTSGSTGKPKGVMLEHRAVHNFIIGMKSRIDFSEMKTIASLTTISFDIFVLESWLPLSLGMTIVVVDPMRFGRDMGNLRVQMVQTTPSTMRLIMNDQENMKYFDQMTEIMLGGEAFPKRLLDDLKKVTRARIYNMYGPTETTVWSMVKELTNEDSVTIGLPIANTQIYLIDSDYHIVGTGEEGEIAIAGDGVARGYLYREELTKERFIPDAMLPEKRMYRTGDWGRRLNNGEIEFLGRIDSQVKVRGFRIELEEIENVLIQMDQIKECVVSTKKNKNDEKYLVAYYVGDVNLSNTEIIQFLKKTLPEYMIPGVYLKIDEIPLTPNGKVNHLALPIPRISRKALATEYVQPSTEMERTVEKIWENVMNVDEIGVNDNFFELGGNSILVSQVFVELTKLYGTGFDITDLFIYPTIAKICEVITELKQQEEEGESVSYVRFENSFYISGYHNKFVESNYEVPENICRKLKDYAVDHDLNLRLLYVSAYMYYVSVVAKMDQMDLVCRKEADRYQIFHYDFSLDFTLDDMCRDLMVQSEKEKVMHGSIAKVVEKSIGRNLKADLLTAGFDSPLSECCRSQIDLNFQGIGEKCELQVRFYQENLDTEQIEQMYIQFIEFMEAITQQM